MVCVINLVFHKKVSGSSSKKSTFQWRRCRRQEFDPWIKKIPWRRKWQPTTVFLLGNPINRGAWQATVHGVGKSWTWLSDWTHTHTHTRKHRLFRNQCSDTSENSTNRMLEITNLVLEKTKTFVFYQHSFSKKTSQLTGQSEHALKSQWIWEACQPKFHTHVHACIHTHTHSVPHCLFCRMPQDGHTRVPSPWSLGPVSDLLLSYPGVWHVVGAQ